MREAVRLVEEGYSAGLGTGEAIDYARKAMGLLVRQNIYDRVRMAKDRLDLEPDESLIRPARYQQPVAKLHLTPASAPDQKIFAPTGRRSRVLFIPDEHNDPRHPHRLDVQTWIARYGSEHRHDYVVKAGDSGTFDSVSKHDKDDTLRARLKPGIKDDLTNHLESLKAFERGRDPDWKPRKKKTRGNHEQRLYAFENENPASAQTHTLAYEEALLQFGWQERPYAEIIYIEGVGFSHNPMNGMGRPMGGKTAPHRAAAMLTSSFVYGHTHKFSIYTDPKMGQGAPITIIEGGCALPYGEIEDYALHSPTGWSYGVVDMICQDGLILDVSFVSMLSLRDRYSSDGADVRAA